MVPQILILRVQSSSKSSKVIWGFFFFYTKTTIILSIFYYFIFYYFFKFLLIIIILVFNLFSSQPATCNLQPAVYTLHNVHVHVPRAKSSSSFCGLIDADADERVDGLAEVKLVSYKNVSVRKIVFSWRHKLLGIKKIMTVLPKGVQWTLYQADTLGTSSLCPVSLKRCPPYREFCYRKVRDFWFDRDQPTMSALERCLPYREFCYRKIRDFWFDRDHVRLREVSAL